MTLDPSKGASADELFARLDRCIEAENPNTAIQVIIELSNIRTERFEVPDELLERMLALVQTKAVLESPVAATVLQFFEFASLTRTQKRKCLTLLRTLSDRFTDGDAMCMANEIINRLLIAKG